MAIVSLNVDTVSHGMTQVTVAAGRRHHVQNGAFTYCYKEGDSVSVPNFEVQYLRRDGVIV